MPRPLSWYRQAVQAVLSELRRRRPFDGKGGQVVSQSASQGGSYPATGAMTNGSSTATGTGVTQVPF